MRRRWLFYLSITSVLLVQGLAPAAADGESSKEGSEPRSASTEPDEESSKTFLDSITVTTTRSERTVGETAGSTSVISAERIERELMIDSQDLVRYEPGVFVDSDPTRLGLNGFNIRGIGGNRVETLVDGVPAAEQFDFGPLAATQVGIDINNLQSAEIVRSAGSSLYGSDALGGVVSLTTRSPRDFLDGADSALGLDLGFSGRNDEGSLGFSLAGGGDRWLGSVYFNGRQGGEIDNQGTIGSNDLTRTEPNPIDRETYGLLGKITRVLSGSNEIELALCSSRWYMNR